MDKIPSNFDTLFATSL